jgi:hypothetical protein
VRRKAGNTREEIKRDALLPDAHDHPLRFLIGGDHLALLFSQRNNLRKFQSAWLMHTSPCKGRWLLENAFVRKGIAVAGPKASGQIASERRDFCE